MPDETVEQWKQNGSLYLWRYLENTRNFPGWHLSADDLFCQSFADLTEKMLASRWSSQKTLLATPPDSKVLRVPNNRGGEARFKLAESLLLKYPKDKVDADYFSLEDAEGNIILSVGTLKLRLLNDCILGTRQGKNRLFDWFRRFAVMVLVTLNPEGCLTITRHTTNQWTRAATAMLLKSTVCELPPRHLNRWAEQTRIFSV